MDLDPSPSARTTATRLVVADWTIDPEAVVTTCRARDPQRGRPAEPGRVRAAIRRWFR